jgi:SAM-dependent methyltransferase
MKQSLFRKLQNELILDFANSNNFKEVVEIGGTFQFNNKRFFNDNLRFVLTNLEGESCDQIEDVTQLTFPSNSIESILCISVLQHVFDINAAIDEVIRVLKPRGKALITNGFMFPVCMEHDYYRLTPEFWNKRLLDENVSFTIIPLGHKYSAIENLLMRPYGKIGGPKGIVNKSLAIIFKGVGKLIREKDSSPLGVAVIITKI